MVLRLTVVEVAAVGTPIVKVAGVEYVTVLFLEGLPSVSQRGDGVVVFV